MQEAKEEVRSRLNIEDVIGEYVDLKRAGRNFKGLSPFTSEKTPSFVVSPDKHIWHDFSSNKGGDIFSFIMEVEGLDFRGALEALARKAGVDLSMYESSGSRGVARKKKRLLEASSLAANYYQHSLLKNQHALDYVTKNRKLSKQTISDFRIGYAPMSGNALVKFLEKKGFSKNELKSAGLTNQYGGDMFRGRMMVPLMDATGQVIGFTARTLTEDDPKAPKYLNTPQTLLYDKGRHVFGLHMAKEAIRTSDYAVVVEGNMDVVSSHQAGVKQVVATAGTAMTEHHLRALARLSGNVRLAFDGDKAGLAATERAVPIAQSVGVELAIVTLTDEAKDPDELIQKGGDLWANVIKDARPVVDWVLEQYSKREDLTSASGKRQFTTAAFSVIKNLNDPVEREHYLGKIAELSNSSIDALKAKLEQADSSVKARPLKHSKISKQAGGMVDKNVYQDNLLAVALIDRSVRDMLVEADLKMFDGQGRKELVSYIQNNPEFKVDDVPTSLQNIDTYVKILLVKADERYADWSDKDRLFEAARLLRQLATEHKKKQKNLLMERLREAEAAHDDKRAEKLRAQLNKLIKETR